MEGREGRRGEQENWMGEEGEEEQKSVVRASAPRSANVHEST